MWLSSSTCVCGSDWSLLKHCLGQSRWISVLDCSSDQSRRVCLTSPQINPILYSIDSMHFSMDCSCPWYSTSATLLWLKMVRSLRVKMRVRVRVRRRGGWRWRWGADWASTTKSGIWLDDARLIICHIAESALHPSILFQTSVPRRFTDSKRTDRLR